MNKPETETPSTSFASQLPNIDELFQSVEREIELERPATYGTSSAPSDSRSPLNTPQKLQLHEALESAFDPDGFDLMLSQRVDKKRHDIVGDQEFPEVVYQVIESAARENWTVDLIRGALEANPNNPQLRDFVAHYPEYSPSVYERTIVGTLGSPLGGRNAVIDPATQYIRAAAVLCTFKPELLKPLDAISDLPPDHLDHPLYSLVGLSTIVVDVRGQVRNCLRDDVRRKALAELLEAGRVQDALKANYAQAFDQSDTKQTIFRQVLTGSLPPLNQLRLEELTAFQLITPWVEGLALPVSLPPAERVQYQIERERLLDPFRQLIGRWEGDEFIEHFRGRTKELRDLRKYVNVAESESLLESIGRFGSGAAAYLFNLRERPPLVIHGPGGVGKSTLMAKFLLQHAEAHDQERFPFVYIDFDRPDVRPISANTLLAEIARQVAVQYPEAEQALLDFRRETLAKSESLDPSVPVSRFRDIHARYIDPGRPLLLVLDTFEEVQQSSRDDVQDLFLFLDRLHEGLPMLRTVIAGRAPVTEKDAGFEADNYPLPNLDQDAAVGFLMSRGITDSNVAAEIISLAGRQPLALKLAADLVLEQGLESIREAAGGTGVVARLRRVWTQTDITGRLYQRLLNHITDPEARKLAHPGLVLRRITPEIIREVLAEPCGLGVIDESTAQAMFDRLSRQISLVAPAEPGVLRHRTDVRQMMLPLILKAESDVARQIQEAAIRFYEAREGTAARAEEIYHRLLLGESPRSVESRWVDGLNAFLRYALDELPVRAQAFVAARINEERQDETWLAADVEDWELYAEQRIRKLLEEDKPERAEELLRQRSDRSAVSSLLGLEALVLSALGREDEAEAAASRALEIFNKAGVHEELVEELKTLLGPPDVISEPVFEPDELQQIVDIMGTEAYSSQRRELFNDIPREYFASIPVAPIPLVQLSIDLRILNQSGKFPDGSHPMVLWLEQAVKLLGKRPEAKALQTALTKAKRRASSKGSKRRVVNKKKVKHRK